MALMNVRNTIKRIGTFFARQVSRQRRSLTTAGREKSLAYVTHKANDPPATAPVIGSQRIFEKSDSAVSLVQPTKLKEGSAGRLIDLLAGECNKKNLTRFTLEAHNIAELHICVFATQQDWHSHHTNAANAPRNNASHRPPRNDNRPENIPTTTQYPVNNVKQENFSRGTFSRNPNVAAQEQTRALAATSSSGTPYVGGGTVVMRVPPMSVLSSSLSTSSSSSFKAGNSTSSLNSSNEGEGTEYQGGKTRPQCQLCGSFFTRKNDLSRHLVKVHWHEVSVCPSCGLELSRPDALKRHEDSGACGKRSSRHSGQGSTGSR